MGWWYIDPHSIVVCGTNALSYIFPWTKTVVSYIYIHVFIILYNVRWFILLWKKTVGWFQESSKCLLNRMRHQWFRPWRRVIEVHRRLNQDFWWVDLPKKKCGDEMIQVLGRFVCWKKWKSRSTTNYTYHTWIMLVKSDEWRGNNFWKWPALRLGCERPHVHRSTDLSPANPDVKNMGVILKERILNVWSETGQFVARTNAHHL